MNSTRSSYIDSKTKMKIPAVRTGSWGSPYFNRLSSQPIAAKHILTSHQKQQNKNNQSELSWVSIQSDSPICLTTEKREKSETKFSFRSIRKSQQLIIPIDNKIRSFSTNDSSILPEYKTKITVQSGNMRKFLGYLLIVSLLAFISMVVVDQAMIDSHVWQPRSRQLKGRKCVLNFFIEKYQRDEFNPDLRVGKINGERKLEDTYLSEGQLQVITRFISSVAGTYRDKKRFDQHILFTGVRDGGYLAEKAFQSWPNRGSQTSELHIVTADTNMESADSLEYSYLQAVEDRFKGKENVHIYDRFGLAGQKGEETEEVDDDRLSIIMRSFQDGAERLPYPDLSTFLRKSDEKNDSREAIIPYMHVDGELMKDQIEILASAMPLFKEKSITSVGIEHSRDMDVESLIKFFNSVGYKTFFLGSRQLARIDNLCPETLNDVLKHPIVDEVKLKWSSMLLNMLGLSNNEEELIAANSYQTPPFYIALPKGRTNGEEMAIQHAYDLFGGFDGEKNVKTANDRVFTK